MKRFHVHVGVTNLETSINFYSTLFASEPTVRKPDYAKWMLDDPRVNFAISQRGVEGLDHLGIQVESNQDLGEIRQRLEDANRPIIDQKDAACCYVQSDKAWVADPSGLSWETFHTKGDITDYGADTVKGLDMASSASCCAPTPVQAKVQAQASCCAPSPALAARSSCC